MQALTPTTGPTNRSSRGNYNTVVPQSIHVHVRGCMMILDGTIVDHLKSNPALMQDVAASGRHRTLQNHLFIMFKIWFTSLVDVISHRNHIVRQRTKAILNLFHCGGGG